MLEVGNACCQVSLRDYDRIRSSRCIHGDRIASTALSNRLRIHWRGAIFANQSGAGAIESDRAADLASIEDGSNVAIRLLIKEKAYFGAVDLGCIAVQVAI